MKKRILLVILLLTLCGCANQGTLNGSTTDSSFDASDDSKSIILYAPKEVLDIGEEMNLTYAITPSCDDYVVTFTSSNEEVASVSNDGHVHALKAGTTTLKVEEQEYNLSDQLVITVKDKIIEIESLTITNKIQSLAQDEEYTLECLITPDNATDKKLTFTSSVPSIASVNDEGVIRALIPGTTTIGVTSRDQKVNDFFELTITKRVVHVSSVTILNEETSLVVGSSLQLNVEVLPKNADNMNLSYSSSNNEYAIVNQKGLITGLKETPEGENVIINVLSEDGEKEDSIALEIIANNIDVTDININLLSNEIIPGDEIKYEVTIYPENASDKSYSITTFTPDIFKVEYKKITALKDGEGSLTFTTNNSNISKTINVTVLKSATYSEIYDLLDEALLLEQLNSSGGQYKSDTTYFEDTYEWRNYSDAIQMNVENYSGVTTSLTYKDNNSVFVFEDKVSDSFYNNGVSLNEYSIGEDYYSVTQEEANQMVQLPNIDNTYGVSKKIKEILQDSSSFNKEEILQNIRVIITNKDNQKVISISGACAYKNWSWDDNKSFMSVNMKIIFNLEGEIILFNSNVNKYDQDAYDQINNCLKEGAVPSTGETINASLTYGTRLPTDSQRINIDSYKVSDFDIDVSNFNKKGDKLVIDRGESKAINIIDEKPSRHLDAVYTISIENDEVVTDSSFDSLLYVLGKDIGTTTITITSDTGVSKNIELEVVAPTVKAINFDYIPNFLMVGDNYIVSASVLPSEVDDSSYTISLQEGSEKFVTLEDQGDGKYLVTAISAGSATLIATANANPSIRSTKTITIKEKPNLDSTIENMCSAPYSDGNHTIIFNEDGTGSLSLQGGGVYSFNWNLNDDLTISFTNVQTMVQPDKWYDFKGASGSSILDDGNSINLRIYDLDEYVTISIQLSH